MSAETLFFICGLGLAALALIVSFIGLRVQGFPSGRGALAGVIGVFVILAGASMTYAWRGAEDEQSNRDEEIAAGELPSPAETMDEMAAASQQTEDAAEGGTAPAQAAKDAAASVDGEALFTDQGCAGCHALKAAGATGTVGPDLDTALASDDVASIEEMIVDPEAEIAKGFPAGVMPSDYSQQLSPPELDALVQFIADAVGAKQ